MLELFKQYTVNIWRSLHWPTR